MVYDTALYKASTARDSEYTVKMSVTDLSHTQVAHFQHDAMFSCHLNSCDVTVIMYHAVIEMYKEYQ